MENLQHNKIYKLFICPYCNTVSSYIIGSIKHFSQCQELQKITKNLLKKEIVCKNCGKIIFLETEEDE